MLVLISLIYPGDDGPITLDLWNIDAPSVAAVERLVREDLGPALRRHGRCKALELGFDEVEYCPQALDIAIQAAPVRSLSSLVAELADQRGVETLPDDLVERSARPRHASREPAQLDDLLQLHGIRGRSGKRLPYRKPKPKPAPQQDLASDDPPF